MPISVSSKDLRRIVVKCRHCTRLIWLDENGVWQRVNHSRSDPGRPDNKCVANNRYGGTGEQRARRWQHEPPRGWMLLDGQWLRKPLEPKVPLQPKPLPRKPQLNHPDPLSVVIPVPHEHRNCRNCRETVAICWDGRYSEDQRAEEPVSARMCGCGDQNIFFHEPLLTSLCPNPGCRLPVGDCVHGHGIEYPATAIRSEHWFGRWLTLRCCDKCWTAEELGDENNHCKMCPCCNCPCTRNGNPPLRCGYPGSEALASSYLDIADIVDPTFRPGQGTATARIAPVYGDQASYYKLPDISYHPIDWPKLSLDLSIPWDNETNPFRLIGEVNP